MKNSILCWLEQSAAAFPERVAVSDEHVRYTYAQLKDRCRAVGSALCRFAPVRGIVGVFMEKDAEALCMFLGAAYAGCAYSALNTELPDQRLSMIADVLRPDVILAGKELKDRAEKIFADCVIVTPESLQVTETDEDALKARRSAVIDTDPLYINFTSGSTGVPKGIAVCHRSVIDFIDCFTELFGITEKDVIANQAPFDFDVSVKDIFSALKTGAELVVIPRYMFSSPARLVDFLCEKHATVMIWAVSALCLLTAFHALEYKTPETIRMILFSGEVMPYKALRNFQKYLPDAMYVNLYGPTEITCNCTYHILEKERDYSGGIPIGIPFPNEDVFLLDGDYSISEKDIPGEICVRGTALALGYFRSPEHNAAAFVQNPLNPDYPELIYRTGDLGKYNDYGELVFCGRKDFQIKYMGHRIELEEIERKMAAIDGVERCCCIFDERKSRLRGFYIGTAEKEDILSRMREELPAYMIPGSLRRIEEMPLTKNGKTDRKKLAEIG